MSSNESAIIFDSAATVIALRLRELPGIDAILRAFRSKFLDSRHDPLENRSLIIEPVMLAQTLRVPRTAVETVVEELHRFNLVHVWVRASCPVTDDDDDVIVETDVADELRQAIAEPCGHCGRFHDDLDWSSIDTFYAIHFDGQDDKFDIKRFFIPKKRFSIADGGRESPNKHVSFLRRSIGWVRDFFCKRARKPANSSAVEQVVEKLELNQPNTRAPSNQQLALWLMMFVAGWTAITILMFLVCRRYSDVITTVVATGLMVVAEVLVFWMTLRMVFSASFVMRTLLSSGYALAGVLLAASTAIHVQWGEKIPFEVKFGTGEVSPELGWCAVAVFFITTCGVLALTAIQGWLSNR